MKNFNHTPIVKLETPRFDDRSPLVRQISLNEIAKIFHSRLGMGDVKVSIPVTA